MPVLARLSAGFLDGIGLFRTIKKPACGRLLVGGFGLFLVNRTHLQCGHPARGGWLWDVAAHGCVVVHANPVNIKVRAKVGQSIRGFSGSFQPRADVDVSSLLWFSGEGGAAGVEGGPPEHPA